MHSDSKRSIDSILSDTVFKDVNHNLIIQCRALISQINELKIKFAPRETNFIGDAMAKECRELDNLNVSLAELSNVPNAYMAM